MPNNRLETWKTLRSQDLFVQEPWVKLSVHKVLLPNGRVVEDYYQIKLPEYATVFARTIASAISGFEGK